MSLCLCLNFVSVKSGGTEREVGGALLFASAATVSRCGAAKLLADIAF